MATWPEARAAKAERQRRERRFLTPDRLGPYCAGGCGLRIVKALADAGETTHATCGPGWEQLLRAAVRRVSTPGAPA